MLGGLGVEDAALRRARARSTDRAVNTSTSPALACGRSRAAVVRSWRVLWPAEPGAHRFGGGDDQRAQLPLGVGWRPRPRRGGR